MQRCGWTSCVAPSVSVCLSFYLSLFVCLFCFLRANRYRVTIEGGGVVGRRRQRKKNQQGAGGWDGWMETEGDDKDVK